MPMLRVVAATMRVSSGGGMTGDGSDGSSDGISDIVLESCLMLNSRCNVRLE